MGLGLNSQIFHVFAGQFFTHYNIIFSGDEIFIIYVEGFIFSIFEARLFMKRFEYFDSIFVDL